MKNFRWTLFIVVVTALAAATWWAWSPSMGNHSVPESPVHLTAPLPQSGTVETEKKSPSPVIAQPNIGQSPAVVQSLQRRVLEGSRWSYDVQVSRTLTLGAETENTGHITLKVAGLLELTVADVEDGLVHLYANMKNVKFGGESAAGGQADPDVVRSLEKAIEAPFFVTMELTGRVEAVHFRAGTDEMARGLLKSVVTTGQVVVPKGINMTEWETEETDSTGDYRAKYLRDDASKIIHKTKTHYVRLATAGGMVHPGVGAGNHQKIVFRGTIESNNDGWPKVVEETEELALASSPNMPAVTTRGRARWELVATGENRHLVGAFQREWQSLETAELAKIEGVVATERQHDEALTGGEPLAVMLGTLKGVPGDESGDADRAALLVKAAAALRLAPEDADQVRSEIQGDPDAKGVGTLLGALGGANTAEANQALAELVKDKTLPPEVRADAASHLGQSTAVTKEHVEALWDGVRDEDADVHSQSLLALGAAAQGLGADKPEDAKSVVETLMEYFANAETDEQRVLALQALGNTGDKTMMPTIEAAMAWPTDEVRAAAAMALRFVQDPAADVWITAIMIQDESSMAKKAAIAASIFRPFPAVAQALETALKHDPAAEVRHAALQTLAAQLPQAVVVLPVITWTAENDADEELRVAAAQILEGAAGM